MLNIIGILAHWNRQKNDLKQLLKHIFKERPNFFKHTTYKSVKILKNRQN